MEIIITGVIIGIQLSDSLAMNLKYLLFLIRIDYLMKINRNYSMIRDGLFIDYIVNKHYSTKISLKLIINILIFIRHSHIKINGAIIRLEQLLCR